MKGSTAQKKEETEPYLWLVNDQDTTSDLREPKEVTKDAIIREIDAIVKKYGSTSTEAIEFLEEELSTQILKKEPDIWESRQFSSEHLCSQISSLSNSWEQVNKESLVPTSFIPSWLSSLVDESKQLSAAAPIVFPPEILKFDQDKRAELPADDSSIASDDIKNTNALEAIHKELHELSQYESDWDGHGSRAISKRACEHAESFARMMGNKASFFEPYPDPDGSVGLEYHDNGTTSMYFNFSADGELTYLVILGTEVHRGHGVHVTDSIPAALRTFIDAVK
jgi:hypothetical protein